MIGFMVIDAAGRDRIARLVAYEMGRLGITRSRVRREWGDRISTATITRIRTADPTVSDPYLAAVGDLLGMPRGFLLYVGEGDIERIEASGGDPDLIRWTLIELMLPSDDDGEQPSKSGKEE